MTWLDDARDTDLVSAMERAGMTLRAKRWGPCPSCNAARTGNDKRPPVRVIADGLGWRSYCCGQTGDVVDLASWSAIGCRFRDAGDSWERVRDWFGLDADPVKKREPQAPKVPRRPPHNELMDLLLATTKLCDTHDMEVLTFCKARGIPKPAPAGVMPAADWDGWRRLSRVQLDAGGRTSTWWPWVHQYRLVVPAFDWRGELVTIHGRDVSSKAPRKTTWPLGYDATGVVFADLRGRRLLQGDAADTHTLYIVEGITDYLVVAGASLPGFATISVASGSAAALEGLGTTLAQHPHIRVFVATDPDETGRKYQREIADAFDPVRVYAVPLQHFTNADRDAEQKLKVGKGVVA